MTTDERLARIEGMLDQTRAQLTALIFINRAMLPLISASRADAIPLLTTAFDACQAQMDEEGWTADSQAAARSVLQTLSKAILDTSR